ncbi:hypothetical protein ACSRUE_04025 [Sorangium sp. KYC3313]|uniref:hypothetical protein n=1 Tax=Sorangium sp. KYC3313 TaxID=3449740 RepID=UPI003F89849C
MRRAQDGQVVDDRDTIRSPCVAGARRLDGQRDEPGLGGTDLGHHVHRVFQASLAFPSDGGFEASVDIHPGGERDGLLKPIVGKKHATAPGARKLDRVPDGTNRPVLRAGIRVVTAEKRIDDEHAAAVHRSTRRKMLQADRLGDGIACTRRWTVTRRRAARAVHPRRGAATGRGERKKEQQEDRGIQAHGHPSLATSRKARVNGAARSPR